MTSRHFMRQVAGKAVKVPTITLQLFDRDEVWYCRNCLT